MKKRVQLKYKTPKPLARPSQYKKPPKPNKMVTLTLNTSTANIDQLNTASIHLINGDIPPKVSSGVQTAHK